MLVFNLKEMPEDGKEALLELLEKMLVTQAMEQHIERLGIWGHGRVVKYWFEDIDDIRILFIKYESGACFYYFDIDLGAEEMEVGVVE